METLQQMAAEQQAAQQQINKPVEAREYFSTMRSLVIHPAAGEQVVANGRMVGVFGEVIEAFTPCGEYGRLVTRNPITIAWIDDQIAHGRSDLLTAQEYNRRITPPEVQIANKEKDIRKLTEQNEALEALLAQHQKVTEQQAVEAKKK